MPTYSTKVIGQGNARGGEKPRARKTAPTPKSGGSDAPTKMKSKRGYKKKNMEYWNNKKKKK